MPESEIRTRLGTIAALGTLAFASLVLYDFLLTGRVSQIETTLERHFEYHKPRGVR